MKHEDEEMKSSVYGFYESEHEYSNKTTTTKGTPNILQQKERMKKMRENLKWLWCKDQRT